MNRLIILIIFFVGCDRRYEEKCVAGKDQREFVIACIREGNPHSDEEGEDLVRQCEHTASRLFSCSETTCMEFHVGTWTPAPQDKCANGKQVKQ